MSTQHRIPRVGIGVFVMRGRSVLLGLRKGAHGAGTWALPGGHLEFGESIESCAAREVLEETGLAIESVTLGPYTNDIFAADDKHYVTLFVIARASHGEPRVLELAKCAEWRWFEWTQLPEPLFPPLASFIRGGFVPG